MPQKIRPSSLYHHRGTGSNLQQWASLTIVKVGASDHWSICTSLLDEGKSIAYKLGRSDRCDKNDFEFSRTFNLFWLWRAVIANGDLTLKIAISFFTLHKLLAKFGDKSRPDPDCACKKAQFEVPHDGVPKFRLILLCNIPENFREELFFPLGKKALDAFKF